MDGDGDRIALMRAFQEAARRLNFTEAAAALGLTPSTLGRRISRLEDRLGVALFLRSTRRIRLTEAGAVYFPLCEELLAALDEADVAASSLGRNATGLLRVAVPATFGRLHLTPLFPDFMALYPDIRLDIVYSDTFVDLVEERIDVAVRIGRLEDGAMRARLLAPNNRRLLASPDYLRRVGQPRVPADLERHQLLHFSPLRDGAVWELQNSSGKRVRVPVSPWMRANDAIALQEAALSGLGIALLADFITAPAIRSGRLTPVLEDWSVPDTGIYALYSGGTIPAKTRLFIDFLVTRMRPTPPWMPAVHKNG